MERRAVSDQIPRTELVDEADSRRIEPHANRASIGGGHEPADRFVPSLQIGAAVGRCRFAAIRHDGKVRGVFEAAPFQCVRKIEDEPVPNRADLPPTTRSPLGATAQQIGPSNHGSLRG